MLSLINIGLRAATLLSKFFLIFFLARFLSPGELGLYGLLVAAVGYALYAVGLDFYTYSTRELLKHDPVAWGGYFKAHAVLCSVLYMFLFPVALAIFSEDWLPWSYFPWFLGLLLLEHVNQELSRIFIAVGLPMRASIILFFRSGVWAIAITLLMFLGPEWRTLERVFQAWALGAGVGMVIGIWGLSNLGVGQWRRAIDWAWVRRGLSIAVPFVIATLALKGLFTLDRYWFQSLANIEVLGAYILFSGICNALVAFLEAGVFAFIYPVLIKSFQTQDAAAFSGGVRKLFVQTVVLSLGFSVCALVMIQPLLAWLDKPLYLAHQNLFPWILAGVVLYALGMIPHYALYAQSLDKQIILSHVLSLPIFVLSVGLLAAWLGGIAVPVGLCIAFFFILCWKTWSYFRLTPVRFRSYRPADRQAVI